MLLWRPPSSMLAGRLLLQASPALAVTGATARPSPRDRPGGSMRTFQSKVPGGLFHVSCQKIQFRDPSRPRYPRGPTPKAGAYSEGRGGRRFFLILRYPHPPLPPNFGVLGGGRAYGSAAGGLLERFPGLWRQSGVRKWLARACGAFVVVLGAPDAVEAR